jgi:serine/threonine-protein kinase HipA
MAVEGSNRHYLWHSIRRSHWNETARRCGLENAEPIIESLTDKTPAVIAAVEAALPPGFPQPVAQRILDGLQAASRRLAADSKG